MDAVEDAVRFVLSNFTLTFPVLGLIASLRALLRAPRPIATPVLVEALFAPFLLFSIGFGFLYNGVMHTVFGEAAARFIGWEDSPFQTELGFASLGFAAVGFLASRRSLGLRLAAAVGPAIFLLGAAGVHLRHMVAGGNYAPGNAGVIFYTDILIPLVGAALLWLQRRYERGGTAGAESMRATAR